MGGATYDPAICSVTFWWPTACLQKLRLVPARGIGSMAALRRGRSPGSMPDMARCARLPSGQAYMRYNDVVCLNCHDFSIVIAMHPLRSLGDYRVNQWSQ